MVTVKILNIDTEKKHISLGMKQLELNPWDGISERFPIDHVTTGTVRNITNFGAFVELEPGIDGLVHKSNLSWTRQAEHPSALVQIGQDLQVIVLHVDVDAHRIDLGHKQLSPDPWPKLAIQYQEGTVQACTVTGVNERGLVVELPPGIEAFVPASNLKHPDAPERTYHVGSTVVLRVVQIDPDEQALSLSEASDPS